MPARFFTRINNSFFSRTKLFLFLCFLSSFFVLASHASAQLVSPVLPTPDRINGALADLNTLFYTSTDKPASLNFWCKTPAGASAASCTDIGFNTDITQATGLKNLVFNFKGAFAITAGKDATWFWDHIAWQYGDPNNLFLFRLCDVANNQLDEKNCVRASMPYKIDFDWDALRTIQYPDDLKQYSDGTFSFSSKEQGDADIKKLLPYFQEVFSSSFFHYVPNLNTLRVEDHGAGLTLGWDKYERDSFDIKYQPAGLNKGLEPGKTYQADMWFCLASDYKSGSITYSSLKDAAAKATYDNIRSFPGNPCNSTHPVYVRMAGMQFTVPTTQQQLTDITTTGQAVDPNANPSSATKAPTDDVLPQCSWFGWGSGTFVGCLAKGVYYAIYWPIAWIAGLFGKLFDFFLGFSISDEAYRMDFVVRGWQIIRDISNIFFIIILVYTGLMAVFKTDGVSMKKVVPQLILNALLINFSLFATRVVIDISNVVARIFYNVMDVRDQTTGEERYLGSTGYKSVSEGVVATFDPQKVFQTQYLGPHTDSSVDCTDKANSAACAELNKDTTSFGAQDIQNSVAASRTQDRGTTEYAGFFIVVSLLAALIMTAVIGMFWKTSFFFLGRTVGLYITMIFAPFAFLTRGNMPLVGGIEKLRWQDWAKDLSKSAMLAPIFSFFLYLLYLLMNTCTATTTGTKECFVSVSGTTFLESLIGVAAPMLIVYFFLTYAIKIAQNYAGFVADKVQGMVTGTAGKLAGFAGGAALGIASGGTSLIGRGLGAAAQGVQNKTMFGDWINRNQTQTGLAGWAARKSNAVLEGTKTSSFDPRNSKFVSTQLQRITKDTGIKWQTDNKLVNALQLGTENSKGGFAKYQDRKNAEKKKEIEKIETHFTTNDDAQKFYTDVLAREFQKASGASVDAIQRITDKNDTLFKREAAAQLEKEKAAGTRTSYSDADVEKLMKEMKKEWRDKEENKKLKEQYDSFEDEARKKYGRVKDNKTLTQAMRLRYAEALASSPASPWEAIRASGLIPVVSTDIALSVEANRKAAEKYIKDTQKGFKGTEKAADELASINKALNGILTEMSDPKNPTAAKYKGYKNHDDMDYDLRDEMLKEYRSKLEAELEAQELKLSDLKNRHNKATGAEKDALYAEYMGAAKKKNETKDKLDESKNILNRRDRAQEKVDGTGKGKEEKKSEGGEKPKA